MLEYTKGSRREKYINHPALEKDEERKEEMEKLLSNSPKHKEEIIKAAKELIKWCPNDFPYPSTIKKSGMYEEGDEEAPFFSEAYLYNLMGKGNARTILGLLNGLLKTVGINSYRDLF